jgi:putative oxidoreductase
VGPSLEPDTVGTARLASRAVPVFGAGKLNPKAGFWFELFGKIGIGQWLRYFTGSLEVVGAVLLLIPKTSAIAAVLLALTMVGAVATHLFILRDGYAAFFPHRV